MTLTIEATGNPKPTVRFFRGTDELVAAEGQIELKEAEDGQTFTATILSMQPNQQGDYTATAQNTGGSAKSKKCKVTVSSKFVDAVEIHMKITVLKSRNTNIYSYTTRFNCTRQSRSRFRM